MCVWIVWHLIINVATSPKEIVNFGKVRKTILLFSVPSVLDWYDIDPLDET